MHNVQVFPLIGLPQFNGWSQVIVAHDQSVICALAVEGQNAGNIGRDLAAQLQAQPFTTAAEFFATLQSIVTQTQELEVKLLCAAAFIQGQTATYACFNGTLILKRQAKVGQLLSADQQLKVIQGQLLPDDLLILTTNTAQSFFGEIQQKATQGYEAEVIMNSLVSAVHTDLNSATMSLAFLALVPEEEVVPAFVDPDYATARDAESSAVEANYETAPVFAEPGVSGSEPAVGFDLPPVSQTAPVPGQSSMAAASQEPGPRRMSVVPKVSGFSRVAKQVSRGLPIVLKGISGIVRLGFRQILSLTRRPAVGEQPELPEVFVSHRPPRHILKVAIPVAIILGLLGAFFLFWRQQRQAQFVTGQATSLPLVASFEQAESQLSSDPVASRAEMQRVITELEVLHNNNASRPAVQAAIDERLSVLKQKYDAVSGKEELDELPVFFDLSTVHTNFITTDVASASNSAVFVDGVTKQAIVLDLLTKEVLSVGLDELPTIVDTSLQDGKLLTLGQGVRQKNIATESASNADTQATTIVEEGDSNREAKLLASFSDYLYVLNPIRRNIYRYLRGGDKVSEPIGWLKPGQPLPYEDLNSIKVDGDVWLSTKTGEIWKLSLGERADFVVSGLSEPFSSSLMLDTQPDWQNIYLLEPSSHRMVVLSKTGQFVKEVKSSSLASATHLVANESQGLVVAVSGSVIFELKL